VLLFFGFRSLLRALLCFMPPAVWCFEFGKRMLALIPLPFTPLCVLFSFYFAFLSGVVQQDGGNLCWLPFNQSMWRKPSRRHRFFPFGHVILRNFSNLFPPTMGLRVSCVSIPTLQRRGCRRIPMAGFDFSPKPVLVVVLFHSAEAILFVVLNWRLQYIGVRQ